MWRDNQLLMQLFEREELEALVCGGTDLDFNALQDAAKYEDGFEETSQVRAPLAVPRALVASSGCWAGVGAVRLHATTCRAQS